MRDAPRRIVPRRGLRVRAVGQGGDLVDEFGHIYAAYDLGDPSWVLVRPGGHVALMAPPAGVSQLETSLEGVGLTSPIAV